MKETKRCFACQKTLPLCKFTPLREGHYLLKNPTSKGVCYCCKKCAVERAEKRATATPTHD